MIGVVMKTNWFSARDQHRVSLCFIIFLGFSTDSSRGYVRLNPAHAQVCVGQQLEITCTTNETALLWNFVPHLINNQGASVPREWLIASEDLTQQLQQFTTNSTSFAFRRTSMRHDSPLVSTLTITNSSTGLNMTNVSCTEVIGVELAMVVLTTIIIIGDNHTGNLSPPEVSTSPVFEVGSISVTLEWIPEEGISYSVSFDQVVDLRYAQRTGVALTVPYNIRINVTITAVSCGQNSETAIISVPLAYVRCEDPLLSISDNSVIAIGYRRLSVNETVVTFSCPPGLTLNGPDSVMCTHTGQWEPALSDVNCSENIDTSRSIITNLPGTDVVPSINFESDNSEGGDLLTVVVASLSTVLLVFSVITFTVGFICGRWFGRKFKGPLNQASSAHPQAAITPPVPIYESMLPDTTHEEQAIELEENVAYGPSTLVNVS